MKKLLAVLTLCFVSSLAFGVDFSITTPTTAIGAGTPSRQISLTLTGTSATGSATTVTLSDGGAGGAFWSPAAYTWASGCAAGTCAVLNFVYTPAVSASGSITITATPTGGLTTAHSLVLPIATNNTVASSDNFSGTAGTNMVGRAATTGGTWTSYNLSGAVTPKVNGSNGMYRVETATGYNIIGVPTPAATNECDVSMNVTNSNITTTYPGVALGVGASGLDGYWLLYASGWILQRYAGSSGAIFTDTTHQQLTTGASATMRIAIRQINSSQYLFGIVNGVVLNSGAPAADASWTCNATYGGMIEEWHSGSPASTDSVYSNFAYTNVDWSAPSESLTLTSANGTLSGTNCAAGSYSSGTSVSCSAIPSSGYSFTNWTGTGSAASCSTGTCSFTISAATMLTANYTTATTYALSTATAGAGSGSFTGSTCAGNWVAGTAWSCTAAPSTGSTFASLSDTCGGTPSGSTDSGTMPSSACAVTATFTLNTYTFAVSTSGGTGSTSGTNCTSGTDNYNTSISCTATPGSGYAFTSWTGTGSTASCSTGTCSFSLSANTTLVANFTAGPLVVTFPNTNIFQSPYTWRSPGDGTLFAPTGGAYLKFTVTGTSSIIANIDTSILAGSLSATDFPALKVYVNDLPAVFYQLTTATSVTIASSLASTSTYQVVIFVMGPGTSANNWSGTNGQVHLQSLQFSNGATLSPYPIIFTKNCMVLGDSYLAGYFGMPYSTGTTPYYTVTDPSLTWSFQMGKALQCEVGSVGIGSQGYYSMGNNGYPQVTGSWNRYDINFPRVMTPAPDYLINAEGINDSGLAQSDVQSWITAARTALPTTKIFLYAPVGGPVGRGANPAIGGANHAAIVGAVAAQGDPNVFAIDSGTTLVTACNWSYGTWFNSVGGDNIHPNPMSHGYLAAIAVQGVQKALSVIRAIGYSSAQ